MNLGVCDVDKLQSSTNRTPMINAMISNKLQPITTEIVVAVPIIVVAQPTATTRVASSQERRGFALRSRQGI